MYREIIEKEGRKWDDCKVLAFAFDGPGGPEIFHYELMYPLRPVYHLFDCSGNVAYVVVPKDPGKRRNGRTVGRILRRFKDNPKFAIRWKQT